MKGFAITYLSLGEVVDTVVTVKRIFPNDIAVRETNGNTIRPLSTSDDESQDF